MREERGEKHPTRYSRVKIGELSTPKNAGN